MKKILKKIAGDQLPVKPVDRMVVGQLRIMPQTDVYQLVEGEISKVSLSPGGTLSGPVYRIRRNAIDYDIQAKPDVPVVSAGNKRNAIKKLIELGALLPVTTLSKKVY